MAGIRPATPNDAAALHAVARETFPLACPPGSAPGAIAEFIDEHLSEQRFADYLADPQRALLIADDFAGYAMLVYGEPPDADVAAVIAARPTVELSKLYVLPAQHGAGVAAALVEAAIVSARERGAAGMWLGVNQLNARANAFYEKHGFAVVGEKTFLVGGELHDDFARERVF